MTLTLCALLLFAFLSPVLMLSLNNGQRPEGHLFAAAHQSRRHVLTWLPTTIMFPQVVSAVGEPASMVDMKEFIDPVGIFYLQVPSSFYTLRRSAKGDLPDVKGQGRRGSSIFTAGNMAKAEVIAVER